MFVKVVCTFDLSYINTLVSGIGTVRYLPSEMARRPEMSGGKFLIVRSPPGRNYYVCL